MGTGHIMIFTIKEVWQSMDNKQLSCGHILPVKQMVNTVCSQVRLILRPAMQFMETNFTTRPMTIFYWPYDCLKTN